MPNSGQSASGNEKRKAPTVRWDEERPGCTFSRGDDGRYHYGLWYENVGINLAVDSQELEKVHRRHEAFFGVLLNFRYKGQGELDLGPGNISLEFVKHFGVVQTALDPNNFAQRVQNDADELNYQTAREVKKHPEQKEKKEAYLRAFLKDSAELQEFVGKNSLRPTQLSPSNPEITGWVMFRTSSKWISGWKKPEELILRVPLDEKIFEFPFKLPPKPGEVTLRRRP
jgi:extradiol dioxygenase family protein